MNQVEVSSKFPSAPVVSFVTVGPSRVHAAVTGSRSELQNLVMDSGPIHCVFASEISCLVLPTELEQRLLLLHPARLTK